MKKQLDTNVVELYNSHPFRRYLIDTLIASSTIYTRDLIWDSHKAHLPSRLYKGKRQPQKRGMYLRKITKDMPFITVSKHKHFHKRKLNAYSLSESTKKWLKELISKNDKR
jgi:hypothetical protein